MMYTLSHKIESEGNIKRISPNDLNKEYFFRVPYIIDLGYKTLENDYVTDKAEYLFYRKNEGFKSLNK